MRVFIGERRCALQRPLGLEPSPALASDALPEPAAAECKEADDAMAQATKAPNYRGPDVARIVLVPEFTRWWCNFSTMCRGSTPLE